MSSSVPRSRSGRRRSCKDSEARKRRRSCKGRKVWKGDRRGTAMAEAGVAAAQEERAPPHRPAQAAGTRTLCSVETCLSKAG